MGEKEKTEERKMYNTPFLRVFDYLAKEKLMNQGQFAKVIESESGYISLLRSGKKRVGPEYIARISAEFAKHFNNQQHLNPDYIDGKSQYMAIENVPDSEVLDKIARGANPDYDLVKQRKTQEPHSAQAIEISFMLEKVLSTAVEEIRSSNNETIAALKKQIADKDVQIKDLRNDVAERDQTIANQARRIHELEIIEKLYREQNPLQNWPFGTGVADHQNDNPAHV